MRRTLLLTNDFPPRTGGIQSYVQALAERLDERDLVVYAPSWPGDAEFDAEQRFPVFRHPGGWMVPEPGVRARTVELIREHRIEAVWFGAAAPLALMTPTLRAAGVTRTVASAHGHEVGWSMVPGARRALRHIGAVNDVVTFVSSYARRRIASAMGPLAALEYLPPGVDTDAFRPDDEARRAIRARHGIGDAPLLLCVSRLVPRKGQDQLIRALPAIADAVPDVRLLVVGDGPMLAGLRRLADRCGVVHRVVFAGSVDWADLPRYYAAGDVFAMPCRTRGAGLDVEGLGIVFLEAAAAGLPVIAGRSGGAPETVDDGRTGLVVDGRDTAQVVDAAIAFLAASDRGRAWGMAGRRLVKKRWNWDHSATRLAELLDGRSVHRSGEVAHRQ